NVVRDNFVIIEQGDLDPAETSEKSREKTLGELDYRAAHTMLHEQAIYQQDAEQYQVERLDFDNHKAYVRKVEPDYFTTALTYRTVAVLETLDERRSPPGAALGPPAAAPRSAAASLGAAGAPQASAANQAEDGALVSEGFGDVKVIEK